jgi:polysaccharide pyruvyl transferase WcaK-like protein
MDGALSREGVSFPSKKGREMIELNMDSPLFVLAGNGPYQNRGCEAIVRGTVKILRKYFGDPSFVCVSVFEKDSDLFLQQQAEYDPSIIHCKVGSIPRIFNFGWEVQKKCAWLGRKRRNTRLFREMVPYLPAAAAVLSVGGDNYSLDYGLPSVFTSLDDVVLEGGKPLILWGASVGPFSVNPGYESYMAGHLRRVSGIFARESATMEYLTRQEVTGNVYKVADPAFLMDPVEPRGNEEHLSLFKGAIGMNLSPLMAEYVTGGDILEWERIAADIISAVAERTSLPVVLVPHVTTSGSDDFAFLEQVRALTDTHLQPSIQVIPPRFSAAEIKWIIGRTSLFAGARTHSTIAALSSLTPTLSFAYSIKARGINQDIFGHEDYCLGPDQLKPDIITARILSMLASKDQIVNELMVKIPVIKERAMDSGKYLKEILQG